MMRSAGYSLSGNSSDALSTHDRGSLIVGLCSVFLSIMIIFVVCRIYAKSYIVREETWDDCKCFGDIHDRDTLTFSVVTCAIATVRDMLGSRMLRLIRLKLATVVEYTAAILRTWILNRNVYHHVNAI